MPPERAAAFGVIQDCRDGISNHEHVIPVAFIAEKDLFHTLGDTRRIERGDAEDNIQRPPATEARPAGKPAGRGSCQNQRDRLVGRIRERGRSEHRR